MPTTKRVGSPGPANEKIGGVPTIHYFGLQSQSRGRGQVVRLMWEDDAGIAYEDIRYSFDPPKSSPSSNSTPPTTSPSSSRTGADPHSKSYAHPTPLARVY